MSCDFILFITGHSCQTGPNIISHDMMSPISNDIHYHEKIPTKHDKEHVQLHMWYDISHLFSDWYHIT